MQANEYQNVDQERDLEQVGRTVRVHRCCISLGLWFSTPSHAHAWASKGCGQNLATLLLHHTRPICWVHHFDVWNRRGQVP